MNWSLFFLVVGIGCGFVGFLWDLIVDSNTYKGLQIPTLLIAGVCLALAAGLSG